MSHRTFSATLRAGHSTCYTVQRFQGLYSLKYHNCFTVQPLAFMILKGLPKPLLHLQPVCFKKSSAEIPFDSFDSTTKLHSSLELLTVLPSGFSIHCNADKPFPVTKSLYLMIIRFQVAYSFLDFRLPPLCVTKSKPYTQKRMYGLFKLRYLLYVPVVAGQHS